MLLNNLYRTIFGSHQEPEAVAVNVLHRIQRVCVQTAVEFERQAEVAVCRAARLAGRRVDDGGAAS